MITLTVTSFNGTAVSDLAYAFDELGGTVGRAPTNQLILPDPERSISRVQAQVGFRSGAYFFTARGAIPMTHNGKPMSVSAEVKLAAGDQIEIGGYRIAVTARAPASAAVDPFEAAFGEPKAAAKPSSMATGSVKAVKVQAPSAPSPALAPRPPLAASHGKSSGGGIPDDWDPFVDSKSDPFNPVSRGNDPARPPAGAGRQSGQDAPLIARSGAESSLDAMFGLKGGAPTGDPLAASPLATGSAMSKPGREADSGLGALMQPAKAAAKPQSDHVSDLNAPWANAPKPLAASNSSGAAALPGAVLSWDTPKPDKTVLARPGDISAGGVGAGGAPVQATPAPANPRPALVETPKAARVFEVAGSAPTRDTELLAALQEGLGAGDLRMGPMSPELLRLVGQLLRESTKGTVELLAARAALKREVRADVTTILANSNNSLKFSPSAEVALQYLLGPKVGGFLPPVDSMRDAFDDLRAHQLGVMAGVKAALTGVVKRFDPVEVERKLSATSTRASLIPSSRKARLWEMFEEVYRDMASQAEEDFNALFGDTFLKAYQQYIDQLESQAGTKP